MNFNIYSITVDVDWAPDFMIEYLAEQFTKNNVKCTWFITHLSPVIESLKKNPLFELGIHPNFFEGSSHGTNEDEIIKYCLKIVPNAKSVRMHALFQSSRLLKKLREEFGLLIDTSLYLPQADLAPHIINFSHNEKPLIRIPYFWEDDLECYRADKSWDIDHTKYHVNGLKVFNFHPLYVFLNSDTLHLYEKLKIELCSKKSLNMINRKEIEAYVNNGIGNRDLFSGLLNYLDSNSIKTYTLSEIASKL